MKIVSSKAARLLSLLPTHPVEFYDRLMTIVEDRLDRNEFHDYQPKPWEEFVNLLEEQSDFRLKPFFKEAALLEIETQVEFSLENLGGVKPFGFGHNADLSLGRTCYAICRALKPDIVLETGVAYGVTSAFLLKAMDVNDCGILHSVDLPPLGADADRFVGVLIPSSLRTRWKLHRGRTMRILPELLRQLGRVDMFIHDSLHTYRNMRREFAAVGPYLSSKSAIIADDIQGNTAFQECVEASKPSWWAAAKEINKESTFGLCLTGGPFE